MELILTPSNITFFLGIIGMIFSVFFYFKKPQDKLELGQALSDKDIANRATILQQKEAESKANLLDQQVRITNEANEKKFMDLSILLKDSLTLAQNHIHTVDTKVDGLAMRMNDLEKGFVKLTTVIEERIPRKL